MNQQNNEAEISPFAVDFKTAGRLTSLSPFTIRAYVRSGKLRGTKCGRRWLIPVEELRRLVREGI
jgi:excisionase family DNA binding protein